MADFKISVTKTLLHEGGYTNNPADPGGATNMGIEQKEWPDGDIKNITQDQAIEFYSERYWKNLYSQIENQAIADKLFDLGVLFGVGTAVSILQLTLKGEGDTIAVDGNFGPETLAAINAADPVSLLKFYQGNLVTHAFNVVTAKPQTQVFLKGWCARINS